MRKGVIVEPGKAVDLGKYPADATLGLKDRAAAEEELPRLGQRLSELGGLLAANRKHAMLVVIQGMDASGKDGTIKHCIGPLNPSSLRIASFKAPTSTELGHDFIWRVHQVCPARGEIGIFNRSHYEDVLVVRVENLVPKEIWSRRYEAINAFERHLANEGTLMVKLWLNLSNKEQALQMQERLDDPTKNWKFNADDLAKREKWDDYMEAYRVMLEETSTDWAPWYAIPADRKWVRNVVVSEILVDALERLDMKWPKLDPAVRKLKIV